MYGGLKEVREAIIQIKREQKGRWNLNGSLEEARVAIIDPKTKKEKKVRVAILSIGELLLVRPYFLFFYFFLFCLFVCVNLVWQLADDQVGNYLNHLGSFSNCIE